MSPMPTETLLPDPPPDCRDPELFSLLCRYEFYRWHPDHVEDAQSLRNTLLHMLERMANALDDPNSLLRWRSGRFLLALWREARIDIALKLLADADPWVRAEAASIMFNLRHPELEKALIQLVQSDSSPRVRGSACRGLAGQEHRHAVPVLLSVMESDQASDDQGFRVADRAADALDELMQAEYMARRRGNFCTLPAVARDALAVRRAAESYVARLERESD